jgi:hypothetical protein
MHLPNVVQRKIAQEMSWPRLRAQGCDDGEFYKQNGQNMPECLQSGMDEYSKGFRAGYYSRDD